MTANSDPKLETRRWVDLCSVADVPESGGHYVVHANRALAVFRQADGQFVVIDDTCPHAGGSLSAGAVNRESGCVICPWHAWPFRLADGRCDDNPAIGVRRHPARVVDGRVQVEV